MALLPKRIRFSEVIRFSERQDGRERAFFGVVGSEPSFITIYSSRFQNKPHIQLCKGNRLSFSLVLLLFLFRVDTEKLVYLVCIHIV